MRWASGLAAAWLMMAASVVSAHPPGGAPRPDSEGRVPLYPDGERYREAEPAQAAPTPPAKSNPPKQIKEPVLWSGLPVQFEALLRHLEMDLLLPPVDL